MRERLFALWLCLALAACGSTGPQDPPPPATLPDVRLCAPLEDPPPIAGGIVQPVTDEQRDAVTAFLRGEADLYSWGGRGWRRAGIAKDQFCPRPP